MNDLKMLPMTFNSSLSSLMPSFSLSWQVFHLFRRIHSSFPIWLTLSSLWFRLFFGVFFLSTIPNLFWPTLWIIVGNVCSFLSMLQISAVSKMLTSSSNISHSLFLLISGHFTVVFLVMDFSAFGISADTFSRFSALWFASWLGFLSISLVI